MLNNNFLSGLDNMQKERMRDFLSGLVAGVISVTVCNPLDITRTRLNLMSSTRHHNKYHGFLHALKTMWRQEGLRGYFTGYKVNVQAIPIFHAIFFPIYETLKDYCRRRNFSRSEEYLTSAIIAGSFCNIVTNPIWVIRTRVMAQALHPKDRHYKSSSILRIMRSMVNEQGIGALFKGVSASVLGVSNAVVYFFIYQNIRESLVEGQNLSFNSQYVLLASISSKLVASTMTYPFIVTRTIMQDHRGPVSQSQEMTMMNVIKDVYRKRGLQGFYAGLKPDLLRLLPSNTIVFLVYEFMKKRLNFSILSSKAL